ncbi:hypothetical protein [Botrimarina mediterranea]|uniref:hypothetical protein n=1 Tax=Botrimarina mediterranea TaxID=2528022 RepID=UPI0011886FFA|nr:Leucine Rich repeats (2 copies) [Planctomycetes bacterium K2D]
MRLNDEQIRYGFYYFHQDRAADTVRAIEVSDHTSEQELDISCTQLGPEYKSRKEEKRVLQEWCEYLTENTKLFKVLRFNTRVPQELFDAACHQQNLEHLEFHWGSYKDLSALQGLKKLKLLYIGSGASVESVTPLGKLTGLTGLYVENFQKISDYSSLTALKRLESLTICGDGMGPRYIKVDSIDFLRQIPQLRYLRLLTIRLQSKDYTPILELAKLEHLSLGSPREVKKIYDELRRLPKLKWGLLKENPKLYEG